LAQEGVKAEAKRALARRGVRVHAILAICLSLLLPAGASAKESGVAIGSLVAKPSVSVDGIYDSNVFRTQLGPEGDFGLEIKPTFAFVYPGDNFRWEFEAWYRFFSYFNLGGTNHNILRSLTDFGVSTSFDTGRKSKVGFFFAPAFSNQRSSRGGETGIADGTDLAYQSSIATPLGVRFRPTKAFLIDLDGSWAWTRAYFPNAVFDIDPLVLGNSHDVNARFKLDWRFFPRSHFLLEANGGHVFQGEINDSTVQHAPALPADYFRVWAGLKGDVTSKLSLMGLVGYGNVYYGEQNKVENLTGLDGILARAEIAIRPVATQRLAFGFKRDFYFRYYANRITDTQAYVKYKGLIGGRLAILSDFTYIYRDLRADESDPRANTRTEHQFGAGVGVEVMAQEWFHITARYRFSAVNPSSTNEGEYIDNRVHLGIILGFR